MRPLRDLMNPVLSKPTDKLVRLAEIDAAQAEHDLEMAGPDSPRREALSRRAREAAARARRLKLALS